MRSPFARLTTFALICLIGTAAIAGCSTAGITPAGLAPSQGHMSDPRHAPPGTFVSMVPACACGRHTQLDLLSLSSGRILKTITSFSTGGPVQIATPAAASNGRLFFTSTSGAVCAYSGDYSECPGFTPNSCRNTVTALSPGSTAPRVLFKVSGSRAIVDRVVPNSTGTEVSLALTPCISLQGMAGVFVRDLKSGVTRPVVTRSNRCDGFGPASWSQSGRELVFPFDPAGGKPIELGGSLGCPAGGRAYLALSSSDPATAKGLKLIDASPGCQFQSAAFDRLGIAATEGCSKGDPDGGVGGFLGYAYLMQFNPDGKVIRRLSLKVGLEQSVVATVPNTGNVLVTEDRPANEPYPERDWVWEFNGHKLRFIESYQAEDAAQVLAVPW